MEPQPGQACLPAPTTALVWPCGEKPQSSREGDLGGSSLASLLQRQKTEVQGREGAWWRLLGFTPEPGLDPNPYSRLSPCLNIKHKDGTKLVRFKFSFPFSLILFLVKVEYSTDFHKS